MNRQLFQLSIILTMLLFIVYIPDSYAQQQNREEFSLSIGASAGYAPMLTWGKAEDSGTLFQVFGDLQYHKMTGQLQYTYVIAESIDNISLIDAAYGFHGSLGYNAVVSDELHIPLMLTGGASIIEYTAIDTWEDVSPQIGVTITPYYKVNDLISIIGAFRYLKGFPSGDRGKKIDLMDVSVGVRLTFL